MAEYFINADSGDDVGGDGSSGTPWETLAHAFDNTIADDTITCQDSTATYAFVADTFDHNITIQGEQDDASGAVFDGAGASVWWITTADIIIQGLTFQNIDFGSNETAVLVANGTALEVTISNCIYINISANNTYSGIVMCMNANSIGGIGTIVNVRVSKITLDGSVLCAGIVYVRDSTADVTLTNCSSYTEDLGALSSAFSVADRTSTVTFKNVIAQITGSAEFAQYVGNGPKTVTATYCCFHGYTSPATGTGVITSDPLFVDAPNDDLRLRPTSPCIDVGTLV